MSLNICWMQPKSSTEALQLMSDPSVFSYDFVLCSASMQNVNPVCFRSKKMNVVKRTYLQFSQHSLTALCLHSSVISGCHALWSYQRWRKVNYLSNVDLICFIMYCSLNYCAGRYQHTVWDCRWNVPSSLQLHIYFNSVLFVCFWKPLSLKQLSF